MADRSVRRRLAGHVPEQVRAELAALSSRFGVKFETLIARYDEGQSLEDIREHLEDRLRPVTEDWIVTAQVERILPGVTAAAWQAGAEWDELRRQWRSDVGRKTCGVLWYRPDIERVKRIRSKARISLRAALRVFCADRRGDL